eukprot:1184420-Prorocentrum_minimum.AAC.2
MGVVLRFRCSHALSLVVILASVLACYCRTLETHGTVHISVSDNNSRVGTRVLTQADTGAPSEAAPAVPQESTPELINALKVRFHDRLQRLHLGGTRTWGRIGGKNRVHAGTTPTGEQQTDNNITASGEQQGEPQMVPSVSFKNFGVNLTRFHQRLQRLNPHAQNHTIGNITVQEKARFHSKLQRLNPQNQWGHDQKGNQQGAPDAPSGGA